MQERTHTSDQTCIVANAPGNNSGQTERLLILNGELEFMFMNCYVPTDANQSGGGSGWTGTKN